MPASAPAEPSYVHHGENSERQELMPGEVIPTDTRFLRLGASATSKEIRQAAELSELETLEIASIKISAKEIPLLRNSPKLESLWITRLPLTPDVSELRSLQTRGLDGMTFFDVKPNVNPLDQLKALP